MSGFVDVFVTPVPKENIADYRAHTEQFAKIWLEHGALSCMEVEAEDVPAGKVTSFPQSVALKPDETIFVGVVTYKSRAHRDEVHEKGMKDPRMAEMTMPFDGMRMFWGGFKPFVAA